MIPWKTLFIFNWTMAVLNLVVGTWTKSLFNTAVGIFCTLTTMYTFFKLREEEDVRSKD